MFRGDVPREDVITAMSVTEDDESERPALGAAAEVEEPGLPNELGFNLGITKRSRGTVQHDIAEWNIHKPEFSANNYTLAVAAYNKWNRNNAPPVRFAVVVRVEETSQSAEIYHEIRNSLIALEIQARV